MLQDNGHCTKKERARTCHEHQNRVPRLLATSEELSPPLDRPLNFMNMKPPRPRKTQAPMTAPAISPALEDLPPPDPPPPPPAPQEVGTSMRLRRNVSASIDDSCCSFFCFSRPTNSDQQRHQRQQRQQRQRRQQRQQRHQKTTNGTKHQQTTANESGSDNTKHSGNSSSKKQQPEEHTCARANTYPYPWRRAPTHRLRTG